MKEVAAIDDFFENPERERASALLMNYEDVERHGLKYRGIAMCEDEVSVNKILKAVNAESAKSVVSFYRRYLKSEKNETYIHADADIGTWSAVAFLNEPEQCQGGIAFWRHKLYGWVGQPTAADLERLGLRNTPDLWRQVYEDGFDEFKWEMVDYIPMEFGRAALFSSKRFHSRYPQESFGTEIGNGRLIKTFFVTL